MNCNFGISEALGVSFNTKTKIIQFSFFHPFNAKGFPIDEKNSLALDRVKSVSVMSAPTAVKASIPEKATFRYQRICILLLLKIRKKKMLSVG